MKKKKVRWLQVLDGILEPMFSLNGSQLFIRIRIRICFDIAFHFWQFYYRLFPKNVYFFSCKAFTKILLPQPWIITSQYAEISLVSTTTNCLNYLKRINICRKVLIKKEHIKSLGGENIGIFAPALGKPQKKKNVARPLRPYPLLLRANSGHIFLNFFLEL